MDTLTKDSTATAPRYRFYRMFCGEKIYLFCQIALTPNRSCAALFTEQDWLEWAEPEGLQREEAEAL